MNSYLYDGTAEGLLSAISFILDTDAHPEEAVLAVREDTLFEEGAMVPTDAERASEFFLRLRHDAPEAARTLFTFLLAEKKGMEGSLVCYLMLSLQSGADVNAFLTDPSVKDIVATAKKTSRELHRMKGLLRFEKLRDGAYLARMEPESNILQPLAYYFSRRLKAEDWFIYDAGRRTAARWHQRELRFGAIEEFTNPPHSEDEMKVQALWKVFFSSIAIADRKDSRLQKSNMPMKYWKYLVEKPGE
ncbi:MAG: hypothetical protein A3K90_09195 [Pelodictyon luteolum]|uniref:DUF4130 domain-containing protein n=1 Tax=Pelodictyon luteolum TaxID=1100 RepID=A0A165LZI4_PELLU|nr:TIGR03915 family putative DNA repair protein [Pelodictyon luteolum]KZK74620.1 MAG: hypothetical protein A3K90_09195 [Pelodictyon luteolum]